MEEFSLDDHVKQINDLYRHRRDVIIKAMEEEFTDGTTWTHPEGGLFLWLTFPKGVSARKVFDKCIEQNVAGVLGEFFYPCQKGIFLSGGSVFLHSYRQVPRAGICRICKEKIFIYLHSGAACGMIQLTAFL